MPDPWLEGCMEFAELRDEPHEHNAYCKIIADAIAEDIRNEWSAQQVAANTDSGRHSEGCVRRVRATGELFDGMHRCSCWVIYAAREVNRRKYGEDKQ